MRSVLCCIFFATVALNVKGMTDVWSHFESFMMRFEKKYSSLEDLDNRFHIFRENFKKIFDHNAGSHNYTLGVNAFTDLTESEFKEKYVGGYTKADDLSKTSCVGFSATGASIPSEIDWREKNAVTGVKDQGQCGSCWSFSATGAMEGAWSIKTGKLVSLSEQQLVDCSKKYGNLGCKGGLMDNAFLYAIDNGMCAESEYAYKGVGGSCSSCSTVVSVASCSDVQSNNQIALKEAVGLKGPVSIAIEADTRIFQMYSSGVITGSSCGTNLDHGVLIVGYGVENGIKYWLVKNSWSQAWGDEGYVKIERSDSESDAGVCGIAMQASFPVV
jgi:C1A family cysteine protease